jgi:LPXTG-site transpeptidase (sortase) family protein
MLDVAEQISALIDAAVPPLTTDEIRARVQRRDRRRQIAALGVGILVAASILGFIASTTRSTDDHPPRIAIATPTTVPVARPPVGSTIGMLEIDAIGLRTDVREGIDGATLRRGPGHDPRSAMPGQTGIVVINGHSTIYSHPFLDLDVLEPGTFISLTTPRGRFEYSVVRQVRVNPEDLDATVRASDAALALVTYAPKGSSQFRLVVFARAAGATGFSGVAGGPDSSVGN